MKKFSRLAALIVLSASFSVPILAAAQFALPTDPTRPNITPTIPAQSGGINIGVIKPYSDSIIGIINSILVPVLMAIAFITFLWGVFKYFIWGGENESEKAEGRKFAMWGIIGFVVILSLWGLVNILMGALGLSIGNNPKPPTIKL